MATPSALQLVPVEEYLNSTYCPDMEYIDGVLIERSVPTIAHSVLQMILIQYLAQFQEALRFLAMPEVRTQIIERARYRIPDVLLCSLPLPKGWVVNTVPVAVIEILSPGDRMGETLERFRDYASIGVGEIVQMDPDRRIAHRYQDGSLMRTSFRDLALRDSDHIPFPSDELFERLGTLLDAE